MAKPGIGVVIHTKLREGLFSKEDMARLEELGEVTWTEAPDKVSIEDAAAILADCEIGIGSWGTPGPCEELLAACPKLRLWVHAAGSVKRFFGPHLEGRDLTIASCAPAIAEDVAEMTLGELIVGLKRVLENAAANRRGRAGKPANSRTLADATVGVLGASQVGRRAIRLLRPFGANVLLYDPYVTPEQAREMGVTLLDDVTELCARSDAVTLHTPAVPATKHMLGAKQFAAMADDAVIINTARGVCIDQDALITELEKGRFFAFLDVSAPEPAGGDSPLRKLPNVVLTSHIAGGASRKIGAQAVDDVERFLRGQRPLMAPTADELERIA
jgi:phosphoglycerate dehydrogenase-like enzyme